MLFLVYILDREDEADENNAGGDVGLGVLGGNLYALLATLSQDITTY